MLDLLKEWSLHNTGKPLKLHLGSGENILEGYVNIDLPPSEHKVFKAEPDLVYDILKLRFPPNSVDEIKLNHVLEHFSRVEATALPINWHRWLKIGGELNLRVPDLEECCNHIFDSVTPLPLQLTMARILMGAQDDTWAYHKDLWWKERLNDMLTSFGFDVNIEQESWEKYPFMPELVCTATKVEDRKVEDQVAIAKSILVDTSFIGPNGVRDEKVVERWESEMYTMWFKKLSDIVRY